MNNKDKQREKPNTDTISDLLNLINNAYEILQNQKIINATKLIKEKVMNKLLIFHEKLEKLHSMKTIESIIITNNISNVTIAIQQQIDKMEKNLIEIKAAIKESAKTDS